MTASPVLGQDLAKDVRDVPDLFQKALQATRHGDRFDAQERAWLVLKVKVEPLLESIENEFRRLVGSA